MTYELGKVYLQDTRTGTIYPYERWLVTDRNFKAIVPNPVPMPAAGTQPAQHQEPVPLNPNQHEAPAPG